MPSPRRLKITLDDERPLVGDSHLGFDQARDDDPLIGVEAGFGDRRPIHSADSLLHRVGEDLKDLGRAANRAGTRRCRGTAGPPSRSTWVCSGMTRRSVATSPSSQGRLEVLGLLARCFGQDGDYLRDSEALRDRHSIGVGDRTAQQDREQRRRFPSRSPADSSRPAAGWRFPGP